MGWSATTKALAAAAVAGALVCLRVTGALADCGNTVAASLTGSWQMRITQQADTLGSPQPGNPFTAGRVVVDTVHMTSTCTAAGSCSVTLDPTDVNGFFYSKDIEFVGPYTEQPLTQSQSTYSISRFNISGFGGPNLPPCRPPDLRPSLNLTVLAAAQDAAGAWHATFVTGDELLPSFWSCNGTTGVISEIRHLTLVAVPTGTTLPPGDVPSCAAPTPAPVAVASLPAAGLPGSGAPPATPVAASGSGSNPDRSSFATAINPPDQSFSSLNLISVNALITVGLILFITFPSALFNHTLEENYEEIRGWWEQRVAWLRRLRERVEKREGNRRGLIAFLIVLFVGALLGGLNDPSFGLHRSSAITYSAVILAILVGMTVPALVTAAYRRFRHHSNDFGLKALPAGLAIAAGCVLISRVSDFQPGYLYGVICGVAFKEKLRKHEDGHTVALTHLVILLVAVGAWFAWKPINDAAAHSDAFVGTVLVDDVLGAIFVGGLVGSVISLIPLRFLPGGTLAEWNRIAWGGTFGVATFGLVQVMVRPESGATHPGHVPIVTMMVLLVLFGGMSIASYVFFERRKRARERQREQVEAAAEA